MPTTSPRAPEKQPDAPQRPDGQHPPHHRDHLHAPRKSSSMGILFGAVVVVVLAVAVVIYMRPNEVDAKAKQVISLLQAAQRLSQQDGNVQEALARIAEADKILQDPTLAESPRGSAIVVGLGNRKNELLRDILVEHINALIEKAKASVEAGDIDAASRTVEEAAAYITKYRSVWEDQGRVLFERLATLSEQLAKLKPEAKPADTPAEPTPVAP